ncbi:MAG: peptidyl-prolyl cis-trans isomerase [Candidatus Omnitrophica bacterium]|nr:peptidyl-prolyl cis-trans isomerase [Candidatus Omnitrophota bacterium]
MRKYLSIFYCFFILLFHCSNARAEEVNKIVAVVNNGVITQQELDYSLLPLYEQYKAVYQGEDLNRKIKKAEKDILEQMIENKLIFQEAKKKGFEAVEEEIEKEINEAKKAFASVEEFNKTLERENFNIQKLKQKYERQIIIRKAVRGYLAEKVRITPQEISSYYQQHKDDWTQQRKVKVRMISTKSEDEIVEALDKLRAGNDFNLVAREYSANGDEEVKFISKGEMVAEIDNVIFSLKIGEISGLIKTEVGYHIFKVEGKQQRKISGLPKVMGEIENILWQKKSARELAKWIEELKQDAYIEIR